VSTSQILHFAGFAQNSFC